MERGRGRKGLAKGTAEQRPGSRAEGEVSAYSGDA